MLLNTTIHALVANSQAVMAHVIASVFVRSASPAVFAEVPNQKRSRHLILWRDLLGQPKSDRRQRCGDKSERCCKALLRSFSSIFSSLEQTLNLGTGCLTGTCGRS